MRLLSALHPTTNQKRVIAKIVASPTPSVAAQEISKGANLVSARNMLMKLGMITFANGEAALTQSGQQIATEEGITDQSGGLTDVGQQLAHTNSQNAPDSDQAGAPPGGAAPAPEEPAMNLDAMPESMQLLKHMLR